MLSGTHRITTVEVYEGEYMTDLDIRWRFREMSSAELNHESLEREFFAGESINTRLVREAIQNSLDAGVAHIYSKSSAVSIEPVRVRFSLAGIHTPLPSNSANKYFTGLAPHINALPVPDDSLGVLAANGDLTRDGVRFIVIEDAGTLGLDGNWEQYDDSENEPAVNNHFYWFFRNVGRSGKGDSDNGSWGLGKWVFPDASRANAYIAVSRRSSDSDMLLMGQAVLTKHNIGNRRYAPYGYFALAGDEDMAIPLQHSEPDHKAFIDQCIADFGLQFRSEAGLSVIIPFPRIDDEEAHIETPKILAAIIDNYFYPIINRKLEVILDEGDGSPPIEITADTIDNVLSEADLEESGERSVEGYRSLFEMCRDRMEFAESDYIPISESDLQNFGDKDYPGIANLRRRYNEYQLLPFRISTDVQRKRESKEKSEYRVYVQKDDALREGHDYYVRGTLSISAMNYLRQIRARSLLVVDENEPLAAMLRDSEPPAHTLWRNQNVDRLSEHWVASSRRINSVRYTPRTLLRAMDAPAVGIQKDAFADIFFYERPSVQAEGRSAGGRRTPQPITPLPPKLQDFDIQNTHSGTGFRVSISGEAGNPPSFARLSVAYAVPRGNPLKHYSPNDFRLHGAGALNVDMQGCQPVGQQSRSQRPGNELTLQIDDPAEFALTVQGFDHNRDVYVRVEKLDVARL